MGGIITVSYKGYLESKMIKTVITNIMIYCFIFTSDSQERQFFSRTVLFSVVHGPELVCELFIFGLQQDRNKKNESNCLETCLVI